MEISGLAWFLIGGVAGMLLGTLMALNVACEREYTEKVDYYDLDPIEIKTPSYEDMMEYEKYDEWCD